MQIHRRFRRYYLNHTSIFFLTLLSTLLTMIVFHKYFSNNFLQQKREFEPIYIIDSIDIEDAKIKPNKNIYLLHKEFFNTTNLICQYPKLTIDNQDIWKHLQPVKKFKPDCEKAINWVYVDNGTFRLSEHALQKHGAIVCAYRPILRGKDDFSTMEGARLFPIVDKMPLVSDFFRADCRARDGSFYSNIHSGIMFDAGLHMR